MHCAVHIMSRRRRSFAAYSFVFKIALSLVLCSRGVCAGTESAGQSESAQTNRTGDLTVERIYGEPSLSGSPTAGIEWCPDSKCISYLVSRTQGSNARTELWTIDAATGARKILVTSETFKIITQPQKTKTTQGTGLGRIEAASYFWSPTGDSLLFTGSTNLVLFNLKTMSPKLLVSGEGQIEDPKFSPDGKWVSFVRDWNVWIVN